jgi:phage I-like protein
VISLWTKLVDKGTLYHDGCGFYQVVDDAALAKMAAAFETDAKAPGFAGVPVTYDHMGELTPEQAEAVTAFEIPVSSEAGAWIVSVELRDDGLYGKLENWAPEAVAKLGAGAYAYLSPTFTLAEMDVLEAPEGQPPHLRPTHLVAAGFTNFPRMGTRMRLALNAEKTGKIAGLGVKLSANSMEPTAPTVAPAVQAAQEDPLAQIAAALGITGDVGTLVAAIEALKARNSAPAPEEPAAQAIAEPAPTQAPSQVAQNGLPAVAGGDAPRPMRERADAYVRKHPGVPVHVAMSRLVIR